MTANHPIRRLLARVCSADTMAQIVDPILADIRWESTRAAWLGYVSLAKALLVHGVISMPGMARRTWSDDGHAMPRMTLVALAAALVTAAPLIGLPLWLNPPGTFHGWLVVTLLPQALALTVPAALLLAVPLGFRQPAHSPRLARRTMALAVVLSLVTLALVAWAVPMGNHAFRAMVSGDARLTDGPVEKTFAALREQIETLQLTPGGRVVARRLEYVYQMRMALGFAPLPLALVALAISGSRLGRQRPWLIGGSALVIYGFALFPLEALASGLAMRASSLPPALFAWAPNALLVVAAGVIRRSRRFPPPPRLPDRSSLAV